MLLHQLRTLLGAFHIHSKTTTKLLAIATGHILNEMVLSQGLSIESYSNTGLQTFLYVNHCALMEFFCLK